MGFMQTFNKLFGYNREDEQRRLAELRALTAEEKAERFADLIDKDDFEPSKMALFFGQFWDTFKKPPRQRKYVQKLDLNILIYSLLSFFIKTLDNSNISNAFVSGMKEDLSLYGQERNLFTTFFNVGYIVGLVPSQFVLNRVRPSIWIPTCELVWSGLVMIMAAAQGPNLLYAMRFLLGVLESCAYPGFALVLGSWYRPDELAKRMTMYDSAWSIAYMFSGYIQAGVYTSMNGLAGLAGWRWLFIIDGLIGVPIGLLGYYSVADFPINSRVRWLSQAEKDFSVVRMEEIGRRAPKKLTVKRFFNILKSWRPYAFVVPWALFSICDTTNYWNLWLKDLGIYSVQQINLIPTGGYALGLVAGYTYANFSDRVGTRWPFIMIAVLFTFIGNLLLAIWNIPFGLKFFAFLCPMIGYPLWSLMLTWSAEVFQDDSELRGLLPAMGSTISYAIQAWLPLLIFPTPEAPVYKIGYKLTTALTVVEGSSIMFFLYMSRREQKQRGMVINKFGLAVMAEDLEGLELSPASGTASIEEKNRTEIGAVEKQQ
ncbi:major facilitator superfamily domain-containing protein [Lipomyces tetrasporus]|uniref:Major facilitator superfamily domain-containing protein n=1 Tax=Lipomyces tetrasporus TaxID=54092 RepID=A0AAD7QUE3_9ASCO|nr:major facilitator superfamily domain-containing protein [Lipomyces tetrasporus]KAJ8101579.1 major facilitator superfamily domain-containing protein [Lipomyces tetrasporus]